MNSPHEILDEIRNTVPEPTWDEKHRIIARHELTAMDRNDLEDFYMSHRPQDLSYYHADEINARYKEALAASTKKTGLLIVD